MLVPIIVRPMDDGSYEIVSGHRRKRACELAGVEEIPAIVQDLDDDEATIIMVDSNLQRENILPSERAKAYQMKMEAIRRRAGRPAKEQVENASQIGTHLPRADEIVAQDAGTSRNQVQRFIRLNELSELLRDKVDNGELGFTPAVELSFLKPQEQEWVERALDETQQTPSLSQAQRIKQESKEGTLTEDTVHMGAGNAAFDGLFRLHMHAGQIQGVHFVDKSLLVGDQLQQRRHQHIARCAHTAFEIQGFHVCFFPFNSG